MRPHPSILDFPLIRLTGQDALSVRDFTEGVHVFGEPGSGKSFSCAAFADAFVRAGFGGLVLSVKNEKNRWVEYCRTAGRENDLIIMDATGTQRFDFLRYVLAQKNASVFDVVKLIRCLLEFDETQGGGNGDRFWKDSADEVLTHAVTLLRAAYGTFSLTDIERFIRSAARRPEEARAAEWQASSFCFATVAAIDVSRADEWEVSDIAESAEYFLNLYPALPDKTRGCVEMMISSITVKLTRGIFRKLFCSGETTVTPEDTAKGKIILLDLPIHEHGASGKYAQVLFKYLWQQAIGRREDKHHLDFPPVFLWVDEFHHVFVAEDARFVSASREYRVCPFFISQNLNNYFALGGEKAKADALALIGSLGLKIGFANSDEATNRFFSELVGQELRMMSNYGGGRQESPQGERPGTSSSFGASQQLIPEVLPRFFTELPRPSERGYSAALIFKAGRRWSNGKTWLPVRF